MSFTVSQEEKQIRSGFEPARKSDEAHALVKELLYLIEHYDDLQLAIDWSSLVSQKERCIKALRDAGINEISCKHTRVFYPNLEEAPLGQLYGALHDMQLSNSIEQHRAQLRNAFLGTKV